MKRYEIELDETVAEFYEDIARVAQYPVNELLSDVLFKQTEEAKKKIADSLIFKDE